MKGKVLAVEEEKKLVEEGRRELMREIDELKRRIVNHYQVN
jgi:predicted DNA-binding transcriptional regulator